MIQTKPCEELIRGKVMSTEELMRQVFVWRLHSKKIVFTNGCYDLLHPGHIHFLACAKDQGDVLVVGVNTDESVRRLGKGPSRPIQDEQSRAFVLASLQNVNVVTLFNEDTPLELIRKIVPDVLVKGADYDAEEKNSASPKFIVGSDIVKSAGGKVVTVELAHGFSTTNIEKKLSHK